MDYQLRPLSLGELLDRTAELYRNNFVLFVSVASIFAGLMLGVEMLHLGSMALLGYPNIPPNREWIYAASLGVEVLAVSLVAGLAIVAFSRVVAWIYLGQQATVRAAAGSIGSRLARYLGLMTVTMSISWAPLFLAYVALFAILFAVMPHGFLFNPHPAQHPPHIDPERAMEMGIGMLILMPVLLAATVYGALMWLRYSLAMPACVVEDLTVRQAMRRSIDLSKGSRGSIFVLWLLVYVIRLLLAMLFSIPFLIFAVKRMGHPMPLFWLAIQQLAVFVTNSLIGPIYSTGLTLFYYDLRVRKEGFDIEWMMQAAGLTPQSQELAAANPAAWPMKQD
jgi:hypothetical protein